jgi:predicted site-specific integrase-resolvase
MPVEEFLASSPASHILGVSTNTVRQWAKRGELPVAAYVLPIGFVFRRADVERLAQAKQQRRAAPAASSGAPA